MYTDDLTQFARFPMWRLSFVTATIGGLVLENQALKILNTNMNQSEEADAL